MLSQSNLSVHHLIPERVKAVSQDHVEIRFTAKPEIMEKVEKLKGAFAHKRPDISLSDLFEELCDLGIEKYISAPARGASRKNKSQPKSKVQVKRDVFNRDENKCSNCGSHYALEIDHVVAKAKGGSETPDNLRGLCRSCNQLAAIESFGIENMATYLQ